MYFLIDDSDPRVAHRIDGISVLRRNGTGWELTAARDESGTSDEAIAAFVGGRPNGCLMVIDARRDVLINNLPQRGGLHTLVDGDRVRFPSIGLFRVEVRYEARRGVWPADRDPERCPVCKVAFNSGDAVVFCGRCSTGHHDRCFRARGGRCARFGCLTVTPLSSEELS